MEPRRERFGKYHVLERIAQGGMAEVYKVKTVGIAGFEKIQALKRILPAAAREGRFIRSFVDEARIAVELNHRNIVQVFDFGKADGELYLAMELIEGKDLRTALELAQERTVPLPVPTACYVIGEVGAGLDYAHRKTDVTGRPLGIVHCDVSPANVMLSEDGYVKILDFGVARASFASAVEQRRLRGKPRYMAPEQTRGETPTPATDVFALGIVAWEVLTGLPLFDGADLKAILAAVRRADAPRVDRLNPEVPAELARAVAIALNADPASRGTAADLTAAAIRAGSGAGSRALAEWLGAIDVASPVTTSVTDLGASGFTSDTMSRAAHAEATPIPTAVSPTRPVRRGDRARPAVPVPIDEPTALLPHGARAILAAAAAMEPEPTRADPRAPEGAAASDSAAIDSAPGEPTRAEPPPRVAAATDPPPPGATQVMLGHSLDLGEVTDDWEEAPPLDDDPALDDRATPRDPPRPGSGSTTATEAIDDDFGAPIAGALAARRRAVVVAVAIESSDAEHAPRLARTLGDLAYARGAIVLEAEARGAVVAFGLEIAGEDDVASAMAYALDAAAAAKDLGQGSAVLRIGGRAGVAATTDAEGRPRVPTDAIDEARALAKDAQPGRPLFAGGAGRLSSAHFAFRELPARRHLHRRGRVLELLGPRSFDERGRALLDRRGRFVGRGAALDELSAALDQAITEERRITVMVTGRTGTGKSRLVAELVARVVDGPRRAVWVSAIAAAARRVEPFALTIDLMQASLGLPPGRGRAARAQLGQRLGHVLAKVGVATEQVVGFAAAFERAMALRDGAPIEGPDTADLRAEVAAALAGFRATQVRPGRPLVTVLEDLHAADGASREVLRHLVSAPAPGAELLILTTRPEGDEPLPCDRVITVDDLVGGELRELVLDRLGEAATPAAVAAVIARAGGNPLFVEELAAAVREAGTDVPPTARDVALARVDRLSPAARTAVHYAAVAGGAVRARILEELVGEALPAALEELGAEGLLVRADDAAPEDPEGLLAFSRGLLREVIYDALSTRARRDAHARFGRLLASRFFAGREEPPGVIAEHLEMGGEIAGAAAFWLRAGRLALAAFDAEAAVAHFSKTLALEGGTAVLPTTSASRARRREALAGREEAHRLRGDLTTDATDLVELARLAGGDPARLADVESRTAQRHLRAGDLAAAEAAIDRSHEQARLARDERGRGLALRVRGEILERQGRLDDALAAVAEAGAIFRRLGLAQDETLALIAQGRIHLVRAHYEAARDTYAPVVARVRETGDPWLERIVRNHVAVIQLSLGNFADARRSAERALALCRQLGDRAREGDSLSVCAIIHDEVGLHEHAAGLFEDALAVLDATGSKWGKADCLVYAGICAMRRGLDAGRDQIDLGLALAESLGAKPLVANALLARAAADLAREDLDAALRDAEQAARLAQTHAQIAIEIPAEARRAEALRRMGRPGEAHSLSVRAVALLDRQRYLEGSEEEVLVVHARVLAAIGYAGQAAEVWERARQGVLRKLATLDLPTWRERFVAIPLHQELLNEGPPT
ncbi:MAG: protein kinase [Deltaproteobacteria bacterium]|nr:protein kinase [Deltaproteobacteria bacterium]